MLAGVPKSFETCLALTRAAGQVLHLGAGGQTVQVLPWLLTMRELDIKSTLALGRRKRGRFWTSSPQVGS